MASSIETQVRALYDAIGRTGAAAPGQDEIDYWVSQGYSGDTLRYVFLSTAATLANDPIWGQYGSAAANLLNPPTTTAAPTTAAPTTAAPTTAAPTTAAPTTAAPTTAAPTTAAPTTAAPTTAAPTTKAPTTAAPTTAAPTTAAPTTAAPTINYQLLDAFLNAAESYKNAYYTTKDPQYLEGYNWYVNQIAAISPEYTPAPLNTVAPTTAAPTTAAPTTAAPTTAAPTTAAPTTKAPTTAAPTTAAPTTAAPTTAAPTTAAPTTAAPTTAAPTTAAPTTAAPTTAAPTTAAPTLPTFITEQPTTVDELHNILTATTTPSPVTTTLAPTYKATRQQVLAAYANTPGAIENPDEEAINYWMTNGLSSFAATVASLTTTPVPTTAAPTAAEQNSFSEIYDYSKPILDREYSDADYLKRYGETKQQSVALYPQRLAASIARAEAENSGTFLGGLLDTLKDPKVLSLLNVAMTMAGVPTQLASMFGGGVLGNIAASSVINTANTLLSGGNASDVLRGIGSAILSNGLNSLQAVSDAKKALDTLDPTGVLKTAATGAFDAATKAVVSGKSVLDAALEGATIGGISGAVNAITVKIGTELGFDTLSKPVQAAIIKAVTNTLQGKPLDQAALNAAIAYAQGTIKNAANSLNSGTKTESQILAAIDADKGADPLSLEYIKNTPDDMLTPEQKAIWDNYKAGLPTNDSTSTSPDQVVVTDTKDTTTPITNDVGTTTNTSVPPTVVVKATRQQVLDAYKNTPGANQNPDEAAIDYWMKNGLDSFASTVAALTSTPPSVVITGTTTTPVPTIEVVGTTTTPVPTIEVVGTTTTPVPTIEVVGTTTTPVPTVEVVGTTTTPVPTIEVVGTTTTPVPTVEVVGTTTTPVPTIEVVGTTTTPVPTVEVVGTTTTPVPTVEIRETTTPIPTIEVVGTTTTPVPTIEIRETTTPIPTVEIRETTTPVPTVEVVGTTTTPVPTVEIRETTTPIPTIEVVGTTTIAPPTTKAPVITTVAPPTTTKTPTVTTAPTGLTQSYQTNFAPSVAVADINNPFDIGASLNENLAAILAAHRPTTKTTNTAKNNPAYDKLFAAEGGSIDDLLAQLYR